MEFPLVMSNKRIYIHYTVHFYSDGCLAGYRVVREWTSVEVHGQLKKYYVVVQNIRWAGVPVPRLIPSRQKSTVDQQVRLRSHIGFTGDKGPSRALIRGMKTDLLCLNLGFIDIKIYFQVAVPRLIPSRQKSTVDQQVRLRSHIGFTGDKGPSRALIREA